MAVLLQGKKILITGAPGGIGRAIFERVSSDPSNVICISGTSEGKLATLCSSHSSKDKVFPIVCDLSNKELAEDLPKKACDLMGGLDCVVCNAGLTKDNLSIRMKMDEWEEVIQINLTANFLINRSACRIMLKNKTQGSIVNISSIVGITGNAGQANYSASKGGLIAMTKSLAQEYAAKAIRINCIAPGFIDTKMTESLKGELRTNILSRIPMQRIGTPEEVVGAVSWLLGDDSTYVTGQVISINGGMFM